MGLDGCFGCSKQQEQASNYDDAKIQTLDSERNKIYSAANILPRKWGKNSKIVIVGAGPSGINMAAILIENGYKNVIILEKTDRIGGKSLTIKDKYGVPHDMGTCYMHSEYNVIRDLLDEYNPDNKEIEIDSFVVDDDECNKSVQLFEFILSETEEMVILNKHLRNILPDILSGGIAVLKNIQRYIDGYIDTFGTTKHLTHGYGFLPKPKDMNKINMTYLEWLKKYKCTAIIPTILYTTTTQGYGKIDELPAYYGLLWNRADFLKRLVSISQNIVRTGIKGEILQPMLSKGFQTLWENVVKKANINVKFNIDINNINRNIDNANKNIEINYNNSEKIECDVLFLAINQHESLKILKKPSELEKKVFTPLKPVTFITTLCGTDYKAQFKEPEKHHALLWPDSLLKFNGESYAYRHSMRVINPELFNKKFINNNNKNNNNEQEYGIGFQYILSNPLATNDNKKKLENKLINDLTKKGKKNIKVIEQKYFDNYFPQWSQNEIMKGYPWLVRDEMQGKIKNTYYIGSSISFESIMAVVSYNNELALQLGLKQSQTPHFEHL